MLFSNKRSSLQMLSKTSPLDVMDGSNWCFKTQCLLHNELLKIFPWSNNSNIEKWLVVNDVIEQQTHLQINACLQLRRYHSL